MSNATELVLEGSCPTPFVEMDRFPPVGGFVPGRICFDLLGPMCCLPCPHTDWMYSDNFQAISTSASWLNVVGMACSMFLLLSFAFLSKEKTHRNYLSICLAIAIIVMQLGFLVPLGAHPDQCFDAITPHDMQSSTTCALSGAFLLAGGLCGVMWVFLRALALHLQICWEKVIGKTFMWAAFATGWGIPLVILTLSLIFSGVSYRFGDTCHINHANSLVTFWVPLLTVAAFTVFIQLGTFGYCIKVYMTSLEDNSPMTGDSGFRSNLLSTGGSISPRKAYQRIRKVIELQWRGIAIVVLILADVIFFAVVFVYMDDLEWSTTKDPTKAIDWLGCLALTESKNTCLEFTKDLVVNESTVMAVLILLSLNGMFSVLLLGRSSMFVDWYKMLCGMRPSNEFVSADARALQRSPYEMLGRAHERPTDRFPEPVTSITTPTSPPAALSRRGPLDYFGGEARYQCPEHSYSRPQLPRSLSQRRQNGQWYRTARSPSPESPTFHMDPLHMNKV